jgi:hypothetical protein
MCHRKMAFDALPSDFKRFKISYPLIEADYAHSERQYKTKIQQMKLERNVKENERRTIVKHIQHRKYVIGKESRHVQVRGHVITAEKLSRWMKENANNPPSLTGPLSRESIPNALFTILLVILNVIAIPSGISIRTNSTPGSPNLISCAFSENQQPGMGSMSQSDMATVVIQRILTHISKPVIEVQEAAAVFNDLKLILGCKPLKPRKRKLMTNKLPCSWYPAFKKDVRRLRNSMNVPHRIAVNREASGR